VIVRLTMTANETLTGDKQMTTVTQKTNSATITREILEGVDGSGNRIWSVFTYKTNAQGVQVTHWIERFKTEAEAKHWLKWA